MAGGAGIRVADGAPPNLKMAHLSTSKLRPATKLWRSFNPECSVSGGRITSDDLSFELVHTLGAGVAASWSVRASKVDDESCSLQVRMGLYDERVNALRSIAMGFDTSVDFDAPTVVSLTEGQADFLDFDVLTVSSMMDGQETHDYPLLESNVEANKSRTLSGNTAGGLSAYGISLEGRASRALKGWRSGCFATATSEAHGIRYWVASAAPSPMGRRSWHMNSSHSLCLSGKNRSAGWREMSVGRL